MTTRPLFSTTPPTIAPLDNRVRGYPSVSTISPAEDLARPSDRPVETIRRAISMPTHLSSQPGKAYPSSLSLSPTSNPKILLPLSYNTSQPSRFPSFRSTSRRLSYNLKMRASRHAVPLTFFGLVTMLVFFFTYSKHSAGSVGFLNSHTNGGKLHIYTRDQLPLGGKAKGKSTKSNTGNSGVSRLEQDEEELIAEDDLFWSSYVEPTPKTEEEKLAEKEIADHRLEVQEYDRQHSLRALVWWLAEGGMFPTNYKAPSKAELRKLGGRGTELLLDKIDQATDEDTVFQDGWSQYAKKQYRIVVFSKSYCPFSRKAKSILDNYHLSPSPFVVELDQRTDMAVIQNILQSLTGRRTVPNILLDFHSVGGSDELSLSHSEGGLHRKFEEMGVLPGSARRRPPKVGVVPVPEGVALADGAGVDRPVHADAPPAAPVAEQVAGGIPPPDLDQAGEAALDRHPAGGVPPVQEEAVLEGDHGVDPRPKAISPGEKPKDNPIDNAGERRYARDLIQETEDVAAPYEQLSTDQTPDEEVEVKRAAPVPRKVDVENEHHFKKAAEPRQKQRNGAAALAAAGNGRRRKGSVL